MGAHLLILTGGFAEVIRLVYAIVRYYIRRSLPAQFPDRLFADKRDALVADDAIRLFADKGAVYALDCQ